MYYPPESWETLPGRLGPGLEFLLRQKSKFEKERANVLLSALLTLENLLTDLSVFCQRYSIKGSSSP